MELPQARPLGRKPMHDFLSLYSYSTAQQDPRPPSQGNYLKTQDFLQPLEQRVERKTTTAKEEAADDEISPVDQKQPPTSSIEHILPGGIGTYSISQISFLNHPRVPKPKPEATPPLTQPQPQPQPQPTSIDEHSNCSSYTGGSGFTLWEDSAANKGKTGKENVVDKPITPVSAARVEQWALSEQTPQSFSYNRHNNFNSLSSSQSQTSGHKSQSFMEMIKSAKHCSQDDELDNEESFILKKESSYTPPTGDLRVKVDGKRSPDQMPNTPRSKHSATEQRRRSKINDRFQMLRELIPHSDQKRDKASFLLEVIEYIHFLQEKVHKYEGSYQGWNQEPEKLMPWRNNQRPAESYVDQSCDTNNGASSSPKLLFASKIDERNIAFSPAIPGIAQSKESGMRTATTFKPMDQHPGITNRSMPSLIPSQLNFFTPAQSGGPGGIVSQLTDRLVSDAQNNTYQPSVQCQTYSNAADKLKEKDLTIEGGAINISSVYSKGLLDTLTQALQSSGVDLSQASISMQIELGKQGNIRSATTTPSAKDDEVLSSKQGVVRPRVSGIEISDQPVKKIKTTRKANLTVS